MMTIVVMVKELDFGRDELSDPQLRMVLGSFSQLRCSYQHYENPAHFFLHSLRSLSIIFQCFYCTLIFVPRQVLGNNLFYNVLGSFLWPVPWMLRNGLCVCRETRAITGANSCRAAARNRSQATPNAFQKYSPAGHVEQNCSRVQQVCFQQETPLRLCPESFGPQLDPREKLSLTMPFSNGLYFPGIFQPGPTPLSFLALTACTIQDAVPICLADEAASALWSLQGWEFRRE